MSFLKSNEYMILMNSNEQIGGYGLKFISMPTEILKTVKDQCGVIVVEEQIYWHDIERRKGEYHWELPDKQVNRVLQAGMRCLLCAPITIPNFFPDDWYWKARNGTMHHGLSFWNADAQSYQRMFVEKVIERYHSSDVNVILHGFLGGESLMTNEPGFFDACAIDDFKRRYGQDRMPIVGPAKATYLNPRYPIPIPFELDDDTRVWLYDACIRHHLFMQEPFRAQFNEVWDDLQPVIGLQSEANGNMCQYDLHKAYRETWPETEQWLLMYTYFGNGPWSASVMDRIIKDWSCNTIVEANYCEGLVGAPSTTDLAIELGFQGQIVCPLHPFRAHRKMEPWMYEAIRVANEKWKASRMRVTEM